MRGEEKYECYSCCTKTEAHRYNLQIQYWPLHTEPHIFSPSCQSSIPLSEISVRTLAIRWTSFASVPPVGDQNLVTNPYILTSLRSKLPWRGLMTFVRHQNWPLTSILWISNSTPQATYTNELLSYHFASDFQLCEVVCRNLFQLWPCSSASWLHWSIIP